MSDTTNESKKVNTRPPTNKIRKLDVHAFSEEQKDLSPKFT